MEAKTRKALLHKLPPEQWYALLQQEDQPERIPATLAGLALRYMLCPKLLLAYTRITCQHAGASPFLDEISRKLADPSSSKQLASMDSLAGVALEHNPTSSSTSASDLLNALSNVAAQPVPHLNLLRLLYFCFTRQEHASSSPEQHHLAESAFLALSSVSWTTSPDSDLRQLLDDLKTQCSLFGRFESSGLPSASSRRSPVKKFASLPGHAAQQTQSVDRLALAKSKGPSPALRLSLTQVADHRLSTLLACRSNSASAQSSPPEELQAILLECLWCCAKPELSMLTSLMARQIRSIAAHPSSREAWSNAMAAVAILDFPQRPAETDALAQQWLALLSGQHSRASDLRDQAAAALSPSSSDADLREALSPLVAEDISGSVAGVIAERMDEWSNTPGYAQAFANICKALTVDRSVLRSVLAQAGTARLLRPIQRFIESFKAEEDFATGDGSAFEAFGSAVVALLTISAVSPTPIHLAEFDNQSSPSFTSVWLRSMSCSYSLDQLNDVQKELVQRWLAAMFNDGIADELISFTSPRDLLKLAPTIVDQAVQACEVGVIDTEMLKEGISYFNQDLLNFTVPGVVHMLATQLKCSAAKQQVVLTILHRFLCSEALPPCVITLVAPAIHRSLPRLPTPNSMTEELSAAIAKQSNAPSPTGDHKAPVDSITLAAALQDFLSLSLAEDSPTTPDATYLAALLSQAVAVFDVAKLVDILLSSILSHWTPEGDAGRNERVIEFASLVLLSRDPFGAKAQHFPLLAFAVAEKDVDLEPGKMSAYAAVIEGALRAAQAVETQASAGLSQLWKETQEFSEDTVMGQ